MHKLKEFRLCSVNGVLLNGNMAMDIDEQLVPAAEAKVTTQENNFIKSWNGLALNFHPKKGVYFIHKDFTEELLFECDSEKAYYCVFFQCGLCIVQENNLKDAYV